MRHRFVRFAVLAGVALALFAPASPASAAEFPPGLRAKVDKAKLDADMRLEQRPECNALLSGSLVFGFSAIDALRTARFTYEPVPPSPLPASTLASSPIGGGMGAEVQIHQAFDELGVGGDADAVFRGRREVPITPDVQRTVTILHEVGHLTGVEPKHEGRVDEAGRPISAVREAGLYNTRILNTCFAPRYLIAGAACQQKLFTFDSTYGNSPIECSLTCRSDAGPVVVAWTSSLQSTVTTDTSSGGCHSTRVSGCPPPSELLYNTFGARALFPPTDITMTVTDATGHVSEDTFVVTCTDPNFW